MIRFKKNLIIILLACIMILTSCSMGSYKIIKGDVDFNKDSVSGSYEEFNGYKSTSVKLEEGSTICLNLKVKTEEGSLVVEVIDEKDNVMLNMNSDVEEQELNIKSTGTYKIRVEGDKHKGEFKLDWNINKYTA